MANFEGLIRNALMTQDASDPAVRERVYISSKNALEKMLAANRSLTLEQALGQRKALERAILAIEADYQPKPPSPEPPVPEPPAPPIPAPPAPEPPTPDPVPVPPSPEPPVPEPAAVPPVSDPVTPEAPNAPAAPAPPDPVAPPPGQQAEDPTVIPPPGAHPEQWDYDEAADLPPEFTRRRRTQKRVFSIVIFLLILALLAWLAYALYAAFADGSLLQLSGENRGQSEQANGSANEEIITVLEPSDPSALVTGGRGTAEIINQQNQQMLRIKSVRNPEAPNESAKPILLMLKPGVLQAIAGKRVTVELFAKSGGTGPAGFSISCEFGNFGSCGRKRYRIGLQPEAAVFLITMAADIPATAEAYFAINTDITGEAEETGEGDTVDIVYARLRVAN